VTIHEEFTLIPLDEGVYTNQLLSRVSKEPESICFDGENPTGSLEGSFAFVGKSMNMSLLPSVGIFEIW
jgi:hypothetical protein